MIISLNFAFISFQTETDQHRNDCRKIEWVTNHMNIHGYSMGPRVYMKNTEPRWNYQTEIETLFKEGDDKNELIARVLIARKRIVGWWSSIGNLFDVWKKWMTRWRPGCLTTSSITSSERLTKRYTNLNGYMTRNNGLGWILQYFIEIHDSLTLELGSEQCGEQANLKISWAFWLDIVHCLHEAPYLWLHLQWVVASRCSM